MLRYFLRKLAVYSVTFVMAVTVDWAIPHLMPGNPVLTLMGRIQVQDPKVSQQLYDHYMRAFNLDLPLWKRRHELYAAWVLAELLSTARVEVRLIPSKPGVLQFPFRPTRMAELLGCEHKVAIWSEVRT